MQENFNKICLNCNKSHHISKFIRKKRNCTFCEDCREYMYVACSICRIRKRRCDIDNVENEPIVCKKCVFDKEDFKDRNITEALKLMDEIKYAN